MDEQIELAKKEEENNANNQIDEEEEECNINIMPQFLRRIEIKQK